MTNQLLTVQVIGAERAARALRDPRVLRAPTDRMIREEIKLIERALERRTPGDSGRTARAWRVQIRKDRAVVENRLIQARILSTGRRPGSMPPASPELRAWARRRGLTDRQLFAVRLAIARRGIKGTGYIEKTADEAVRRAPRAAQRAATGIEREFRRRLGTAP